MKDSKHMIEDAREKVKKICSKNNPENASNPMWLKNKLRDDIGQFLFQKTQRRPMILPVVIEV